MTETLEGLTRLLVAIGYGLPRMLACFTVFNLLPHQIVPRRVKLGLMVVYVAFLLPLIQPSLEELPAFSPMLIAVVVKEALLGLAIGFVLAPIIWTFHAVGELIDVQSGANTGAQFDPVSNNQAGPFSTLMQNLAIVFIFSSGAFLGMLGLLLKSYVLWPLGQWFPSFGPPLREWAIATTLLMLQHAVAFAAPFLALLLLVEVGLGFIGRTLPSVNVFMYSMPVKFWLAMGILILVMPWMLGEATRYLLPNWFMLEQLARALGG